jgi:hypothetical protein
MAWRIGKVCNPRTYTDGLEIPLAALGGHDGTILVDLVEPGCSPITHVFGQQQIAEKTFTHASH